jgi:hypothetical protein
MPLPPDVFELYEKYGDELRRLARCMRTRYHAMHRDNYKTAFSDVEGEIVYMLVRERKPEMAFEISAAAAGRPTISFPL